MIVLDTHIWHWWVNQIPDLRRVVMQTLSGGVEQMMTIAEQSVQEGLERGRQEGR